MAKIVICHQFCPRNDEKEFLELSQYLIFDVFGSDAAANSEQYR